MAQDIFSAFKNYATKLSGGEKNPAELANALKDWLEESGEMIKDRIEVEIEKAGERLGFIRKEELEKIESDFESRIDALEQQIKLLSNVADASAADANVADTKVKATKAAKDKASPAKKKASPVKKVSVKKVATKKAASSSVKEKKSPAKKAAK